ncbi:hypothetical protein FQA47_007617 [Oryzias melastigma]|uniref:Uncharacterized protein n=1 Tax=Oryzias melastigma TaxID=30732 RepID=A0A834BY99_ORYME|nr:hypothetical protein FQA47_007617 [Oryzias melastigma]
MDRAMFLCNASAIKDWSYFLSQILPLMNKSTALVSMEKAESVTTTVVTSLQPDGAMSASNAPLNSNHTSGMEHIFQYSYSESDLLFTDYRTPARDSMPLPKALLYLLMAALMVVAGGGRSAVAEGDGDETSGPDWVLGSHQAAHPKESAISCITTNINEGSDRAERLRPVEMSYISLNHTNTQTSGRPEEIVVTIDETLEQRPPDTHSGT